MAVGYHLLNFPLEIIESTPPGETGLSDVSDQKDQKQTKNPTSKMISPRTF